MLSRPHEVRRRQIIFCHWGHENDACYSENMFEYLSACGIDYDVRRLDVPHTRQELQCYGADSREVSLLGFNSQIDHAWVEDEPLPVAAARHGITVVQWIVDHPSACWLEFNYSSPATSRFLFHSRYSLDYFATAGSIGPNWRSRSEADGFDAFSRRPIACLVALGLARLGKSARQTEAEIDTLDVPLAQTLRQAISRARFELDRPLEIHLRAALEDGRLDLDDATFNRCFRLLNDSVQYFRRARIIRIASRYAVNIQSDATAHSLIDGGLASFKQDVGTPETLERMPLCRAVLSVSPVNDSIHDRTCNALNAGCLPILEDNRAHRVLFSHGDNALLFRYDDDSIAECLAMACGNPNRIYPIAERAKAMRDQAQFRFGRFSNIVGLAYGSV
jgi:hypothetical protein